MMRNTSSTRGVCRRRLAALSMMSMLLGACARHDDGSWDPRGAAAYLDHREAWWAEWPKTARDPETFCISCHTALPYALARPALRDALSESAPSAAESRLLDDVRTRVRLGTQAQPYYGGDMTAAARGTESVLNALILANEDARERRSSASTKAAFDTMWALQQTAGADRGAWLWIRFDNEPWEAYDSVYYGATLAALAVGMVSGDYRAQPEVEDALARLRQYLNDHYEAQTPLNRVALLWASARFPRLLDPARQQQIIEDIWKRQLPDGGWSAASLAGDWRLEDGSPLVVRSDGYATGLIIVSLQQVGIGHDPRLIRGLAWLAANQSRWTGHWTGYSLNRRHRSLLSKTSQFMDDAATAYAVLALTGDSAGGVNASGR